MQKIYLLTMCLCTLINTFGSVTDSSGTLAIFHFASTRPAFTEGALLVPKGKVQIESGAAYSYFEDHSHSIQHPSFFIKYGISKFFELRVNGDVTTNKNSNFYQTGLHPLYAGMKLKMMDAKRYAPASSFIGGLSANVISTKNFRTKYVAPYFKISMEQFLPKNVGLMYNYGLLWNGEDAKPTYNLAVATTYTRLLKCSTAQKQHQFKYFFEVYAIYPHGEKFDVRINNGFAYLLHRYLQVDFSMGAGLLKNSPRVITSAGLAVRFPKREKGNENKD